MQDLTAPIMLILASFILLFIVTYFVIKRSKQVKTDSIGKKGEQQVAAALKKIAKKHGFRLINDLYLPLYDKTTQIDHLLIGEFGVLVVETKALNGEIYGNADDKEWTQLIGEQKHRLYNPLMQNKAHIDCLHHILVKEKIYNVSIDSLIVFAGKDIHLNIPKGMPVITLPLLKKYLNKPRYTKGTGTDVEKIYRTLLSHQVTDKALLKNHNKNVKEMANAKR